MDATAQLGPLGSIWILFRTQESAAQFLLSFGAESVLQFLTLGFHFVAFSCIDTRCTEGHDHLENIEFSRVSEDFRASVGMSSNLTAPTIF